MIIQSPNILFNKGLIIKDPHITRIFSGLKTWEIRGNNTKIRGEIFLIKSGSKCIFGKVNLVDSIKLDIDSFHINRDKHCLYDPSIIAPYPRTYAWVLENPVLFDEPIPYIHPKGAIIWVNLPVQLEGENNAF